ncbi:hypothetical protein GCM10014715_83360 [Streptomyces spiralis]|uniref:Uncharacterized protein n=1 Tax=Streptomyces spiralis TaxID=66376 RepID=A0A919E5L7_9ACTN|nr:hypothetical protein GCM10014715_83360 [Streptomyces spiralis]
MLMLALTGQPGSGKSRRLRFRLSPRPPGLSPPAGAASSASSVTGPGTSEITGAFEWHVLLPNSG